MRVCVFGLWHLGTVTAACLASAGHDVIGIDPDGRTTDRLAHGIPPLFEPGLEELVGEGLASGRLRFSTDPSGAANADLVWITFDTPVDDEDRADVDWVVARTADLLPHVRDEAVVLISSQVPVGTTRRIEDLFARTANGRRAWFAYSPENLRLGSAIDAFTHPDRVVVGVREGQARDAIAALLAPITDRIEWMRVESAEMTKHALNAFLATSVAFINEVAAVCEKVGADAAEVERGLKSERRIGPRAYLAPGGAFAGGTLARDVMFLAGLGRDDNLPTPLIASVKASNDAHRWWAERRLEALLGDIRDRTIAVWGLTYKPGTDTLRRSAAVALCERLHARGALLRAHDPAVRELPEGFASVIRLCDDPIAALDGASALVVATAWPEYRALAAADVAGRMEGDVVLDANRFLAATLGQHPRLRYYSVGTPAR